jgi:hypothetical protein
MTYTRRFSFSGFQANQPSASLPGPRLDIELDAIAADSGSNSAAAAAATGAATAAAATLVQVQQTAAGITADSFPRRDGTRGFTAAVAGVSPPDADTPANNANLVTAAFIRRRVDDIFLVPERMGDYNIGIDPTLSASEAIREVSDYLGGTSLGGSSLGGGEICMSRGRRYLVDTSIELNRNVSFRGATGRADPGNPFGLTDAFFAAMRKTGALIIDPAARIRFAGNGGLQSVNAFRRGMALDGSDLPNNFAGSPFWSDGTDAVFVRDSCIVGFDKALDLTHTSRIFVADTVIDCNNGISQNFAADISDYSNVRCYGITQLGATGHEAFSSRSGTAIAFGGTSTGGPNISDFFAYGFHTGMDLGAPGSFSLRDCWIDGTSDATTYRSLDPGRIGLHTHDGGGIELHASGLRICCQATAIKLDAETFSTRRFVNVALWQNGFGIVNAALNTTFLGLTCRGYLDGGIVNTSKAAADSAVFEGQLAGRAAGVLDVNGGTGDPNIERLTYEGGAINLQNRGAYFVQPDSSGTVNVVDAHRRTIIFPSVPITDIQPRTPGRQYTFEMGNAGAVFSGANFKLAGGATSVVCGSAGSTITFRLNEAGTVWVEQSRNIFP